MSALWLEREGRQGDRGRGRERRGMREGQAAVIGKVKRQGACQGVTHVPQGWVIRGVLLPSHSWLLSGTDHWAGVCQNFIYFF